MKQIPNLFTLLNLVFGCMAIVYILQTSDFVYLSQNGMEWTFDGKESIPNAWWYGSLFIGLAAVVDFLDGAVARFFNASSELGKQLDSLADVVSFGVAPAMIVYQLLRMSYMQSSSGIETDNWLLAPAFIIAAAAAYRLGKFNLDTTQTKTFKGVPTPAVGLLVASFPLIVYKNQLGLESLLLNKWVLYLVIAVLAWLMVSKQRMMSLKINPKQLNKHIPIVALILLGLIGAFTIGWVTVPVVFIAYVVLSLLTQQKMTT
jgi:CDP-diacylglycerol---serine O-phosphatidyltransferase